MSYSVKGRKYIEILKYSISMQVQYDWHDIQIDCVLCNDQAEVVNAMQKMEL